jgi:hypothetical protein
MLIDMIFMVVIFKMFGVLETEARALEMLNLFTNHDTTTPV